MKFQIFSKIEIEKKSFFRKKKSFEMLNLFGQGFFISLIKNLNTSHFLSDGIEDTVTENCL